MSEQGNEYETMTIGQLWAAVWGGRNAADCFYGHWQAEALARHESAWAELVKRGAARFKSFESLREDDR